MSAASAPPALQPELLALVDFLLARAPSALEAHELRRLRMALARLGEEGPICDDAIFTAADLVSHPRAMRDYFCGDRLQAETFRRRVHRLC